MTPRSFALALAMALCALIGFSTSASAAPADLDSSFAGDGILNQRFTASDWGDASNVLAQPDGKILIAGRAAGAGGDDQMIARFNADGTLDTSFGTGGFTLTDYATSDDDRTYDMALMDDGRIVTVGAADWDSSDDSTVTRYLANGALDTSFSGDGKLRFDADISGADVDDAEKVAVSSNGKITVAGSAFISTDFDVYVRRLNVDGNPDVTFNGGTTVFRDLSQDVTHSNDDVGGLVVRADGSVVVAATYSSGASTNNAALIGIDPTGAADTLFGTSLTGQRLAVTGVSSAGASDLVQQPDGQLALLYSDYSGTLGAAGIVRWNSDASSVDSSFGSGGHLGIAPADTGLVPYSFALLGDGSFLLGGYSYTASPGRNPFFAKATAGGALDPAFGSGGVRVVETAPDTDGVSDVAVQGDGKFLGAGYSNDVLGHGYSAQVIRMNGNYVAPPPPPPASVPLTVKLKSPSKSTLKASKLKSIAGTAEGTGLVKVQLAIQKVDSKLLKKSKRCLFVTGSSGKTKKYKAVKKKCAPTKYLTAKGTTSWSYKVKLKPGTYKIFLVGVGDGGRTGKSFAKTIHLNK